ncbi:MAG: hypothetical protein P8Y44_04465 [Acidobacteriota bacterium]
MKSRHLSKDRASTSGRAVRRWIGALLTILLVELLLAGVEHRGGTALRAELDSKLEPVGAWALFVLTNRDRAEALGADEIAALVSSGNPLLREWIFTTNPSRLVRPRQQERLLEQLEDPGSAARARFYFDHGIHKTPWLSLAELDGYLETLDD